MNCRDIREKLTSYLLGDLDAEQAATVRAHVEQCAECKAEADRIAPTLAKTREALAATRERLPKRLSETAWGKIRAQRAAGPRPERQRKHWYTSPSIGLAAMVLFLLAAAGVFLPATQMARRTAYRSAAREAVTWDRFENSEERGSALAEPSQGSDGRFRAYNDLDYARSGKAGQDETVGTRGQIGQADGKTRARQRSAAAARPQRVDASSLRNVADETTITGSELGTKVLSERGATVLERKSRRHLVRKYAEAELMPAETQAEEARRKRELTRELDKATALERKSPLVMKGLSERRLSAAARKKATRRRSAVGVPPPAAPAPAAAPRGVQQSKRDVGLSTDPNAEVPEVIVGGWLQAGEAKPKKLATLRSNEQEPRAPPPQVVVNGEVQPFGDGDHVTTYFAQKPADQPDADIDGLYDWESARQTTSDAVGITPTDEPAVRGDIHANGNTLADLRKPTSQTLPPAPEEWGVEQLEPIPEPPADITPVLLPLVDELAAETDETEEGADTDLITMTLDGVPLRNVVQMFTRISGANMIAAGTNLQGTVTVNLEDAEWKPALTAILDMHGYALIEKIPDTGVYSIEPKSISAPPPKKEEPLDRAFGVNPFVVVDDDPLSTFSIDVDTASYTLSRNHIKNGQLPPYESVRTEEFVNAFDYAYRPPEGATFAVSTECAPTPFGRGLHLLKIGVKGRRLGREEQRPAVLTFLIDTSGSMNTPERLGLIRKSLRMLVEQLGESDQVALIQFSSHARLVLQHTRASEKETILKALDSLQCSGSTNMEEGMRLAYATARAGFVPGGENRVLILSDGAANLGSGSAQEILAKVAESRKQGIYCSVFGFGFGTYDDSLLETLANKGDGTYVFIDGEDEAKRVLVDDLAATLNVIGSDVKIQVEFNPARVLRFRQLGYENRKLKHEQFRDDTVDAGEVGSGQSVTALYEVELKPADDEPLGVVRLRYRNAASGLIEEIERGISPSIVRARFEEADSRFRLAACAAEFAELLRNSPYAAGSSYADVARVLHPIQLELNLDTSVVGLLDLVQRAPGLPRADAL